MLYVIVKITNKSKILIELVFSCYAMYRIPVFLNLSLIFMNLVLLNIIPVSFKYISSTMHLKHYRMTYKSL